MLCFVVVVYTVRLLYIRLRLQVWLFEDFWGEVRVKVQLKENVVSIYLQRGYTKQ